MFGNRERGIGKGGALKGAQVDFHDVMLCDAGVLSLPLGALEFVGVTLSILEAYGIQVEALVFGNSQTGGRVEAAAEENHGFLGRFHGVCLSELVGTEGGNLGGRVSGARKRGLGSGVSSSEEEGVMKIKSCGTP